MGQTFSERETLNNSIVREIDKASDPWGVKILRYELMNITPSANVVHTLEKQMEAEREKRAEITRAAVCHRPIAWLRNWHNVFREIR